MVKDLPFAYNLLYRILDYLRSLNFDSINVRGYYTEFVNKEADLRIVYWKEARFFTVKYLGVEYHILPLTIPNAFFEDLIYSREPIEVHIVSPDNSRLKYNNPLFLLVDIYPPVKPSGAVALTILMKEKVIDNPLTGEAVLHIDKFSSVDNIEDAIDKTFLEAPSILASIYSEVIDKDYIPWIESYTKNIGA